MSTCSRGASTWRPCGGDGVTVCSPRGDFRAHPHATDDPAEIGPVDIVFLGLKAYSYATRARC